MSTILSPSRIEIGAGSLSSLKEIVASYYPGRILIVTDEGIRQAGILDRVVMAGEIEPSQFDIFDRVQPNPDIAIMEACGQVVVSGNYALIIGLGGGSPMDVAKAGSILPANGGRMKPLLGRGMVKKSSIPLCLIPTTSGTGSEVSQSIVVSDLEIQTKTGIWDGHVVSQYAIVDAELTIGMSTNLTADTGLDALVHAIEAYTARTTNPIARMYARESIRLVVKHLPKAVKEGNDLEARLGMSLAATLAGLAFSNGGLGGAHALNLPLDSKKHIPHGRTVAILAPWVMDFNRKGNETVYAEIASLMGEEVDKANIHSASQRAVRDLIKFIESVGISPYLTDHGIKAEEINDLAKEAFRVGQRLLVFNPRDVTEDDVIKIYQAAAKK